MDPSDAIQILVIFILILLSAFFSSAETALTTCNKLRMRSLADEGNKRAAAVLKITENQGKMLSAILIGNNIVNLSASSLMTTLIINLFGNAFVGVGTGLLTLLILIFGEITPKTMASNYAEKMSLIYAGIIHGLMVILTPVIFIVNKLAEGFMRLFGIDPNKKTELMTESELRTIVNVSHEEGVIENEERKMINNVVDFGDAQAKDVMVPRIDMVFASIDDSYEQLMNTFKEEWFTRLPVYQDTTDNVIGIINMKDLLLFEPSKKEFHVKDFLREAYYTYEFKKTSELFLDMRNNSVSMAIVLDEYGATAGLVTMEDLLEEIVGEIRDEYDESESETIQKLSDREYLADASIRLDDLNDILELSLSSEDYDSLGGLVIGLLEHLPKEGEEVMEKGITFHVESVDKNRIEWIRMLLPEKDGKNEEENS